MKKVLLMISILALVGVFGGCNAPDHSVANAPTELNPISPPPDTITVRGVVESVESRNVYSSLGLITQHVHVEVGDLVRAGQVLAVLDSEDLELNIARQKATLEQARQSAENALADSQRMLNEATSNLANNTNPQILNAQATLSSAEANLTRIRADYEAAQRDLEASSDLQVIGARTALTNAQIMLGNAERSYEHSRALYVLGALSSDDMRQAENTRTIARNTYNDAQISYENAQSSQTRTLEQLRISHSAALTARQSADEMLRAARVSATQEIERLRSNVRNAELSGNLEHMEIAIEMLERQLDDAVITAPIDGIVTAAIAREGAIGAGLMFVVEDTSNLRVITRFREYDIAKIEEGMEVRITSDATSGAVYAGVINRINPAAIAGSPVVEFEAEVIIKSAASDLRIGATAWVEVGVYSR